MPTLNTQSEFIQFVVEKTGLDAFSKKDQNHLFGNLIQNADCNSFLLIKNDSKAIVIRIDPLGKHHFEQALAVMGDNAKYYQLSTLDNLIPVVEVDLAFMKTRFKFLKTVEQTISDNGRYLRGMQ